MPVRLLACLLAAGVLAGCASDTPTGPSSGRPGSASAVTLTGHVTATNGNQPLAGLAVDVSGRTTVTDAAGSFTVTSVPSGLQRVTLAGSGIIPRSVLVAAGANVAIDAISTAGFDLAFYRMLVRNSLESATLEPLRRWPAAPSIYLRTIRADGVAIDAAMLNTVDAVIREAMPQWSGFSPAAIVRGTDSMSGREGWVTVFWPGVAGATCGVSHVATSGGSLQLYVPTPTACGCDGTARIRPGVIRHELGHVMGFRHTDNPADVMYRASTTCDQAISARERAAAAIAYRRPEGNTDPDSDPAR